MMRILGIDPGSSTALAWFDLDDSLTIERAKWGGSKVIRASASKFLTPPERDFDMRNRIAQIVGEVEPNMIVLEEPVDGAKYWRGTKGRAARGQSTSTSFRLGVTYGLAVSACRLSPIGMPRLVSYPVKTYGGRPGWMASTHTQASLFASVSAAIMGASADAINGMSDHELMAMGVALHHVEVMRNERFIKAIKSA